MDDHPLEQENIESEEYEICACKAIAQPGIRAAAVNMETQCGYFESVSECTKVLQMPFL